MYGRVAQRIRRPTSNRKIVGSIPIVVMTFRSFPDRKHFRELV